MQSLVTIIIPTFNRARLVARAIDSALGQTYPNFDVVVVDDGSTDDTQEVIRAYAGDPRVRLVRHERNRGVTAAINTGLSTLGAETLYFGLLGSDDALEPEAVETLVPVFEAGEDSYSMVFGWCRNRDSGAPAGQMTQLARREGLVTYDDALSGAFSGDFWQLVRRDLMGDLKFEERARGGEGSVWWRLLRERPGWLVPKVVYNVDTSSADRLSRPGYTPAEAVGMMWVQLAMLRAVGQDLRLKYPALYGASAAELAKWAALAGERRFARVGARQALRYSRSRRALLMFAIAFTPPAILGRAAAARSGRRPGGEDPR